RRFLGRGVGDPVAERIGLAAATIYLFNPGVIFDSSVWGQVDSVGTLAIIGTLYLLARGWTEAASVGAVICLLLKYQFAFMIPIVAIVGIKRFVFGRSSDPEQDGRPDALRVLTSVASGLGSLVLLIFPYGLAVFSPGADPSLSLIGQFTKAASTYTGLTINAFNLWMNPWSGLATARDAGGLTPSLYWGDDQNVAFVIGSFNVNCVYTADWSFYPNVINPGMAGQAMPRDPVLQATLLSPWGIYLISAAVVVALGWLLVLATELARQPGFERRHPVTDGAIAPT